MKIRHFLLWPLAGICVLALLAAAALYWAGRSETVLRWGVERIATTLPCSLTVQGIRGAFMKPVQVQYLACENADFRVEARNIALVWSPWRLTRRQLDVTSLHLDALTYTSKPGASQPGSSQPLRAPQDLSIPIAVDVASVTIASLVIATGNDSVEAGEIKSPPIELSAIDAAFHGGKQSHRLVLRHLASQWGQAAGEATIGASAPLPLAAKLTVASDRIEGWPATADIGLSGDLQKIDATVAALVGQLRVNAELALAPFTPEPIQSLTASASDIDAAAFDKRLPSTSLSATVKARPTGASSLAGSVHAENTAPGRLDQQKLPVHAFDANFALDRSSLRLPDMRIDLGAAGTAAGTAQIAPDYIALAIDVSKLDLQAAHGDLRQTSLQGSIRVDHRDNRQLIAVDLREKDMQLEGNAEVSAERIVIERVTARAGGAQLRASGTVDLNDQISYALDGSLGNFDPARFGDFPQASINGTLRASGELRPDWYADVHYQLGKSRLNAVALAGNGKARLSGSRLQAADLHLDYGGNELKLTGGFGTAEDTLNFSINADRLDRFEKTAAGQVRASGTLGGTLAHPSVTARFHARKIAYGQFHLDEATATISLDQVEDPVIHMQAIVQKPGHDALTLDSVEVKVNGTRGAHAIDLAVAAPQLQLVSRLDGGWDSSRRTWSGVVAQLENKGGDYPFRMKRAATIELAQDRVLLGATEVTFSATELKLGETRYQNGGLRTNGTINGVRAARVFALMKNAPAVDSTLVLGGRWELEVNDTVDGFVEFTRTSGDIIIPGEEPLALELKDLRVTLRAVANRITAEAVLRSAQVNAQGTAQTRLEKRGTKLGLPGTAPLSLQGEMQMRSIRPIAALASRAVTADGSLKLAIKGNGTIAGPRLSGAVEGDNLMIEHVANGMFFREGVLRANFSDDALTLTQLRFKGGQGELTASGRFSARKGSPVMELRWATSQLAVIQHPDLRLTVSGAGQLDYRDAAFSLKGELTADQGRVELRNRTLPSLGDDVVISGRDTRSQIATETKRANLDLTLDMGQDFTVVGRGLNARMEGRIRLTSGADKPLSADGEIRVASGTFEAYGRRLQIEEGALYFAGPVNNPGINIRAMRKNQPVEAGVEVTGTARDPRVRLVSDPEVSDPDKLAWLVLGRQAESSNTQDRQTLQTSAMALAAGLGTTPLQQQLARSVGLDEITFVPGSGNSEGGVVAVGKQISDKIYVTQEFGTSAAGNTLRVSYQLARRWSLRTESGDTDAIDLFFTISFD